VPFELRTYARKGHRLASTLTQEDLDLLRLLTEAGVPAQVVLSKADLLSSEDRQQTVQYVREQIRGQLGLDLPISPVSTVGADEALLVAWFDKEIAPLFAQHRAL
jgi:GTP-binding protein EngB required for normal cell division